MALTPWDCKPLRLSPVGVGQVFTVAFKSGECLFNSDFAPPHLPSLLLGEGHFFAAVDSPSPDLLEIPFRL